LEEIGNVSARENGRFVHLFLEEFLKIVLFLWRPIVAYLFLDRNRIGISSLSRAIERATRVLSVAYRLFFPISTNATDSHRDGAK